MITKKLSPKGQSCRVTFELPAEVAEQSVAIVGDFNDWDPDEHQMKLFPKKGVWQGAVSLKPGESHQFRYFIDGAAWRNDEDADDFVNSGFDSQNCLLQI